MRLTERICSCWELLTTGTLLAWELDKFRTVSAEDECDRLRVELNETKGEVLRKKQTIEYFRCVIKQLQDDRDHYIERAPELVYTSWHGYGHQPAHKRTFDVWKLAPGHYRVSIKAPGDEYDEDASLRAAMQRDKPYSRTRRSRTAAIRLGRITVRMMEFNESLNDT
jgi:hypothetical protein